MTHLACRTAVSRFTHRYIHDADAPWVSPSYLDSPVPITTETAYPAGCSKQLGDQLSRDGGGVKLGERGGNTAEFDATKPAASKV